MFYLFLFIISLFLTALATLGVKKLAIFLKVIDWPDKTGEGRKIHKQGIPLLGGLGIFVIYFALLFIFSDRFLAGDLNFSHLLAFSLGALVIVIGGAIDDKYNLAPQQQIIFPLLAIALLIFGGVGIERISNPFGGQIDLGSFAFISQGLLIVWLLGMMYTTKLLDGVDGLVSGVGAIGALVIFLFTLTTRYFQPDIALAAVLLLGSLSGFLIFNWHPAKIFLGEGGSLLIGYILGVLAIISGGKIAIALLVMGIPVLDVLWTIFRRILQGKNPWRFADKKHLHHRLLNLGLTQRQTVLVFFTFSSIFGISGLFLQSRGKFFALLVLALIMIIIVIVFNYLDRRFVSEKPKLLLHVCCAPCSSYITRDVLSSRYQVIWYFYNSNLNTLQEYKKRLAAVKMVASRFNISLIVEPYKHPAWLEKVKGREADLECGPRCQICYFDRLFQTAKMAKKKKIKIFSTSLLVSPYKNTELIGEIGKKLALEYELEFLAENFQANDGYRLSQNLAKELGLYRQKFCGCEFSFRPEKSDLKKIF